ncbi:two-component sensor histidine kinase [Cellulomonas sp. Sa3CUA2]|uniref:histidine kinase n=1 Tax=Cellulomonas avistercoris TaxID=2762242 RepID=A0ABR8QHS0_9CELL|nr:histidine kinase [Cellulomonas avistercoris]MBD7919978.1 two-component sensor histidine kinase [Cellulomonas avistercoris]
METARADVPEAWWAQRLSRLGVRDPLARDVLLSVVVAVLMLGVTLGTVAIAPDQDAPSALAPVVLVVVAQAATIALRRVRLPLAVAGAVLAQVALVALAPEMSLRTLAPFVVAATLGTTLPAGRALRWAAAVAGVEAAATAVTVALTGASAEAALSHALSAAVVWVVSALVGTYVATRREHLRLVQERAADLERERDTRIRAAVADERARLARELHDVAAHHLSGMVVQAAAVERLVARDPDAARAGAVWLRDQGRETLDNLRQVVGLLRGDDATDGTAPLPGLAALGTLVAGARDLGDTVEVAEVGAGAPLPPLTDVSLYRVAQQALTNARQHAPGAPVRVRVERTPGAVALDVVNAAPVRSARPVRGAHGGAGLAVMRERAALVGGTLDAGPTGDGGWRVTLRVPVDDGPTGAVPAHDAGQDDERLDDERVDA